MDDSLSRAPGASVREEPATALTGREIVFEKTQRPGSAWPCSKKTLFAKTASALGLACGPTSADPRTLRGGTLFDLLFTVV